MKHRIQSLLFSMIFFLATGLGAISIQGYWGPITRNLKGINKTLAMPGLGALDGYNTALSKTPVLEILYAWQAFDTWEAYGSMLRKDRNIDSLFQPITEQIALASYADVTADLQQALNLNNGGSGRGGIYIPRFVAGGAVKLRTFAPNNIGVPTVFAEPGPILAFATESAQDDTAAGSCQAISNCLLPMGTSWDKCPSSYFNIGAVDEACTAYTLYPSSTMGSVKCGSIASPSHGTTGIVYRDANGIHFRRFEGWQNIALPMVSAVTLGQNPSGACAAVIGGYVYNHQLEETGRGLVTGTVVGAAPLHILATDRFGWGHTSITPFPGGKISPTSGQTGERYIPGLMVPIEAIGPDIRLIHSHINDPAKGAAAWFDDSRSLDAFMCVWNNTGITLSAKQNGYPAYPDYKCDGCYRYRIGHNCLITTNPFTLNGATVNDDKIAFYKYYDENNTLQSLPINPALDAAASPFPGAAGRQTPFWFAFDRTPDGMSYKMGTGTPNSEADIAAGSNAAGQITTLYSSRSALAIPPYLRNFAFTSLNTTSSVLNIQSNYLNPGEKFCTPPFCGGRFLFWRDAWQTPNPTSFTLTFKARGSNIQVAFGSPTPSARAANAAGFDVSYNYAIRANTRNITIEKGAKGPITSRNGGNPAPGSTSLTPTTLTASTLATAAGMTVNNNEVYNDYWISVNNGTIQFGTGNNPGQNVLATATDATTPPLNNYYYCFSGDVRSTDYINIQASPYQLTVNNTTLAPAGDSSTNGQYVSWQASQVFPTAGRGALVLNYANAATSADPNAVIMFGLTTDAQAKTLLQNTQAASGPAAAAPQLQAIIPDYQIQWGTNGNTSHQIFSKTSAVMTTAMPVNPDGSPSAPVVATSSTPNSFWVAYDNGTIAYGSGSTIGQNLMAIWNDPSPGQNAAAINAFVIATPSSSMRISITGIQTIPDQKTFPASPGAVPTLQPMWQFSSPNAGAVTFNMAPPAATGTSTPPAVGTAKLGLCSTGANAAISPIYEIIINDNNTAYVSKQSVKQTSSVVALTSSQIPSSGGSPYWAAFQNGTILLGTGLNPLDTSSVILNWQDSTFTTPTAQTAGTPPITRFTLSATNAPVVFSNITVPDFTQYATAFTAAGRALQQQATTQTAWQTTQNSLTLTSASAKLLYWSQQLAFNQPGSTSFSYTVQKADNSPLTLFIGLSDTLPAQDNSTLLGGAKYYIALTDTGTIQILNGQGATAPAAMDGSNNPASISNIAALKNLLDGSPHQLWVSVSTSTTSSTTVATIKIGLDTAQGTSPVFTYQLTPSTTATSQKSTMTLPITFNYVGLGAGSSAVNISSIQVAPFSDPTSYTTTGTGQFAWQNSWTFGQSDEESVSFILQTQAPTGSLSNQPVAIIGLATASGAEAPLNGNTPFNGASYVIAIDYTQQVCVMKAPNFTTRLGNVLYSAQNPDGTSPFTPTTANATPSTVNIRDNKPHLCTLSFDHGLMRLSIAPAPTVGSPQPAQQVVWTFADTSPISDISRFSFTSTNNTVAISNIATLGAQSLDTVQGTFSQLLTTLTTNPSAAVTQLSSVVAQRLHVADAGSASFFLTNVVQIFNDNAELFSDADRATIASVLTTTLPEPMLQSNGQNSPVISTCIATMSNPINWPQVIYSYYADTPAQSGTVPAKQSQINAVFNPTKVNLSATATSPAGAPVPLSATNSRRILLMHKIAALPSLPSSALNMPAPAGQSTIPSVLLGIQQLTPALTPYGSFLTTAEQALIATLSTLSNPSGVLANTQDPSSMLAMMSSVPDQNMRVTALQGLLTTQYNALANPSLSNPVAPLTTTANAGQTSQVQQVMNWLFTAAYNRDELTVAGRKSLALALQLVQALPFFQNVTVDMATFNNTVASTKTITATSTITTTPSVTLASGSLASATNLPAIVDIVALANTPVNFSYQVAKLVAQASIITVLPSNDPRRLCYFQTLNLIPASSASMLPADITTLNTKVLMPLQNATLSNVPAASGAQTEATVISNLSAFLSANTNNISQILKNTEDPSTILALVPTLLDPCQQVSALQVLLSAQRAAAASATPATQASLLSNAQCNTILSLLYSVVCNRDALDTESLQNLLVTLQIAAATPGLSNLTVADTGLPSNATNNTAAVSNIYYQAPAPATPAAISIAPLSPAVTTTAILPGQSTPTSYDLTTALNIPVPFSAQVTKLAAQVTNVITFPSTDPRRQQFFKYLGMVGNTSSMVDQASLAVLNNKVLVPLQNTTLISTESAVITALVNLMNNPSTITNKALSNIQSPATLLAAVESLVITPILNDRDAQVGAIQNLLIAVRNSTAINPGPTITASHYQTLLNVLYLIARNRDELNPSGAQSLTATLQLAAGMTGFAGLRTSAPVALPAGAAATTSTPDQIVISLMPALPCKLSDVSSLASTPPSFHDIVTKLVALVQNIMPLPSTDPGRTAYFTYLGSILNASITMPQADINTLMASVITPLQNTALTQSESAILTQVANLSSNISSTYTKILSNTSDPINMLALLSTLVPQSLSGTRDMQITALQNLLIAQRNASLSNPSTPLTATQYQTIVNLLFVITQNRDELSDTGMQSLLFTLQLATANNSISGLTTLPASQASSDDTLSPLLPTLPAHIADMLALANTPIAFSAQVAKLTTAVSSILTLPNTNPSRQAYFQYLSALVTAANNDSQSMQPSDLASLANNVIIPLQRGITTATESAILAALLAVCNDVDDANSTILRNVQDPASMLTLLYTMAPVTLQGTRDQQISALQALLTAQRNATSSTTTISASSPAVAPLTSAQYQAIVNVLYLITINRDELSTTGMQNLLTTLQLAATNTGFNGLNTSANISLTTSNKSQPTAPQVVASLMPSTPASISSITALANTPFSASAQITKLLSTIATIKTLPSSDVSRQAYFQYLANIINSPIAMQPADINSLLNNIVVPLQQTPTSQNESTTLGNLASLCTNYYSSSAAQTILSNTQDPVDMLALLKVMAPGVLQGTRDVQINALQGLLSAQRNATSGQAAAVDLTPSQYQDILNLLYLIVINRDELSSSGSKVLIQALQLASANSSLSNLSTASTSTTAIPSVPPSVDDIIAALLPNTPATTSSLMLMASTPLTFGAQVAKVGAATANIILQPSTSIARQAYFQYLSQLPRTTLTVQSTDLITLNSSVVTPLSQTVLAPNEQAVVANLQQFVAQAKSAAYQLGLMPQISDWATYISTLQGMLANQGISTIFANDDYTTFMNCLTTLLNNREILQANSLAPVSAPANATTISTTNASQSVLMQQFMTLLNTASQTAAFAPFQNTLTTMIATAPTDHIFAERISCMQSEVSALATTQQANSSDPSIPVIYNRLITKLGIILNATGAMTTTLFNALQISVITPLLALITNNPNTILTAGLAKQVQAISNNIQANQATIIAQQSTFAYQYSLAQLQLTNPSTYVSMLQGIISGARQGTITFASGDAQTFLNALTSVVNSRDNLSTNDLGNLATAINFALYADIYSNAAAQNTLQQLLSTATTPVPFADRVTKYSGQVKSMLKLQSTDPQRVAFFTCLSALPNSPGTQSATSLNALQNNIIAPLAASPISTSEKATLKALQSFYTTAQANIRSASYQLNALLSVNDMIPYIAGLQDMITRQGSFFNFTPADYETFANQVVYVVNSRELLDGSGLAAAQTLVTTTLANANFSSQTAVLTPLVATVAQPYYFNDRVTWMATEVQTLVSRNPLATDPMLIRFFTKLNLLLTAAQVNTSDQQFNILQTQVLTPLGSLSNLNVDQQNQLQSLSAQFLSMKSQVLLNQTTFQYQFGLAQAQITNPDAYLSILANVMVQQHNGSLTFGAGDGATLLTALQALVNNRDTLNTQQIAAAKTLFTYCLASTIYQDKTSQATLAQLLSQVGTQIPLIQLVPKYVAQVSSIVFLPSNDAGRTLFFTQLNNMTQSTDAVTPALITQITNGLITPLSMANPSSGEQNTIKTLQNFVAGATQKAQSVSYLLQMADDSNLDLMAYATAVTGIMQQKDNPLTFSDSDETTAVGAFAYICACRELLSTTQVQAVQQLISNILFLGRFSNASTTQLQTIQTTLPTAYLFEDRLSYASQEMKALLASNANPAGNRVGRLIARLGLILQASGPATTTDFNNLQAIIQQLQNMQNMPATQAQNLAKVAAQMAANMSTILEQQQTFTYNYQQAQILMNANNLSAYVSALLNIITLKRQNQMTFNDQDYRTFVQGLTAVVDHQDAMSASDLTNLKTALNYTYYSNGFVNYQSELAQLNALLTTPPTFGQRVAMNASKVTTIMQLDSTDPNRVQFFIDMQYLPKLVGSGALTDIQNLVTNVLTPLQTAPLSAKEQETINTLTQFVASVQQQAVSLTYNLTQLAAQVNSASNTSGQDPVTVLINGLSAITLQISGGTTKMNGNDYQTLITMLTNIVSNNELLSASQITQVQTMLQSLKYTSGFAPFQDALTTLYNSVAVPLTFAQRVTKYAAALPQVNSAPVGDASKTQFVAMLSSIFSAPGTMSTALLTTLQNQVINPVKNGNFSAAQQAQMSQLLLQLAAAQTTVNTFSYRLSAAQAEPTQQAEYLNLTQIINDATAGNLTMAPGDYTAFLSELTTQVALRPLTPNNQSELYSLVTLTKSAPTFSSRADLVSTLTQLTSLLNTPVDPITRTNYFTQNIAGMLGRSTTSGQRQQFFAMLSQFASDLAALPTSALAQPSLIQALQTLTTTLNQQSQVPSAQPSEQAIMISVARALQDTASNPVSTAATSLPGTSAFATGAIQLPAGYNVGAVTVPITATTSIPTTVTARTPVSRFYSGNAIQRMAQ